MQNFLTLFLLRCFQIYACMMVFFFSNMIENQLMSTGAFEITLNGESFTVRTYLLVISNLVISYFGWLQTSFKEKVFVTL